MMKNIDIGGTIAAGLVSVFASLAVTIVGAAICTCFDVFDENVRNHLVGFCAGSVAVIVYHKVKDLIP